MEKHTELPWRVQPESSKYTHSIRSESDRYVLGISKTPTKQENTDAAFIVEACNNHYRLLAENKRLREALDYLEKRITEVRNEIVDEISSRPQHPNIGKKGCVNRINNVLSDIRIKRSGVKIEEALKGGKA